MQANFKPLRSHLLDSSSTYIAPLCILNVHSSFPFLLFRSHRLLHHWSALPPLLILQLLFLTYSECKWSPQLRMLRAGLMAQHHPEGSDVSFAKGLRCIWLLVEMLMGLLRALSASYLWSCTIGKTCISPPSFSSPSKDNPCQPYRPLYSCSTVCQYKQSSPPDSNPKDGLGFLELLSLLTLVWVFHLRELIPSCFASDSATWDELFFSPDGMNLLTLIASGADRIIFLPHTLWCIAMLCWLSCFCVHYPRTDSGCTP